MWHGVAARGAYNAVRQTRQAARDELAALREQTRQMKEVIRQQLDALDALIDAYADAVTACCVDMVNGGDRDPRDIEHQPAPACMGLDASMRVNAARQSARDLLASRTRRRASCAKDSSSDCTSRGRFMPRAHDSVSAASHTSSEAPARVAVAASMS